MALRFMWVKTYVHKRSTSMKCNARKIFVQKEINISRQFEMMEVLCQMNQT